MKKWTLDHRPDQTGRIAIVTGANTWIGFETASALAAKNTTVVLARRNKAKSEVDASQLWQVPEEPIGVSFLSREAAAA